MEIEREMEREREIEMERERGKDKVQILTMTEPYRKAINEKWDSLKKFYEEHNETMSVAMTVSGDTILHIAAQSGKTEFVESLLEGSSSDSSMWRFKPPESEGSAPLGGKNDFGNTVLHEAASGGHLEMVELLLKLDPGLLEVKNYRKETPLFRAAAYGKTEVVRFLAPKVEDMKNHSRRDDKTTILHIAVLGNHFETALEFLKDEELIRSMNENDMTCFQLLANMPSAFRSGFSMGILAKLVYYCLPEKDDDVRQDTSSRNEDLETGHQRNPHQGANRPTSNPGISKVNGMIWRFTAQVLPAIRELWDIKKKQRKLLELIKILAEKDLSLNDRNFGGIPNDIFVPNVNDTDESGKDEKPEQSSQTRKASESSFPSETPLIAATRNGIIEIVRAILKVYPQAIEHVNRQNENIFHVAVRYRMFKILDFLQSSAIPISRLRRQIAAEGDSILHEAAYLGKSSLRDRPGEALHLQFEIQWFKRVQKIVPPYFINHVNKEGFTAERLFSREHKKLVECGQEWLMRTTKASTLVAVLIATVAFTCAYTVPGGSNSKTGQPLLLKTTPFIIFTTSDTLSLCFALTSVVVFLSIMTSKMQEQDFHRSLPLKLVLGLTTLFFSVAFMMVAFVATLVLMISHRLRWVAIPIYSVACFPVTIFLILEFPLYMKIAWFTMRDLVQSFVASLPAPRAQRKSE